MWAGFDKCEFSVQLQREQLLVRPKGTLPEPNQFQIDISFWPYPVLLPAGDNWTRCFFDTVPAPALRDLFGMSATCKTHCEHLISLTGTHHCHWQISAPTQAYATQFMLTAVSGWWGWLNLFVAAVRICHRGTTHQRASCVSMREFNSWRQLQQCERSASSNTS